MALKPNAVSMRVDPASLANVTLRTDAESFAAALEAAALAGPADNPGSGGAARKASDTRKFYEANFSPAAYRRSILDIVLPLVKA